MWSILNEAKTRRITVQLLNIWKYIDLKYLRALIQQSFVALSSVPFYKPKEKIFSVS